MQHAAPAFALQLLHHQINCAALEAACILCLKLLLMKWICCGKNRVHLPVDFRAVASILKQLVVGPFT